MQATLARAPWERTATFILRYGLVAILVFFGAFKFTAVEAEAIQPLVANSPFLSWLYLVFSVQGASTAIGITELVTAALLAARPWSARASFAGSLLAIGTFATTLSFLATTPGIWVGVPGFPVPVPNGMGAFLLKDLFLLGAAVWSAAEARRAL
ncbi:MAG TPA: DUF417 family protein [Haliangiales bacterium]|nr:DUF417 family protein [Haliangiales bacterium]